MRVWIDQDLCTGDGICTELAPKVFMMHDDGLAYVKDPSWPNLFGPSGQGKEPMLKMAEGTAEFADSMLDDVVAAAEECPGECIFIEV
jgi:ferredoxin